MSLDKFLEAQAAKPVSETFGKCNVISRQLLEELAAAYFLKTNLAPDECELVQQVNANGVSYYFRRKGSGD